LVAKNRPEGVILSEANPRGQTNPRYKNGNFRRKMRARFKAMDAPCGICHGRYGPIHYDEPSSHLHPLSFVIDEIIPVSRWKEFGFASPEAVARDASNLQAAHWICNSKKSNHLPGDRVPARKTLVNLPDGDW
jgi:5-methylcytosine-specific restriction endonuclease McrA